MPIVFGWGKQTIHEFGVLGECFCRNCQNSTNRHLIRRRTWFTLFFIPIIPYRTEYFVVCPICKSGAALDKGEFEILYQTIPAGQNA